MSEPFERFTDRAKQVLATAKDEARRLSHSYIGTEHLLLDLVRGEGVAARVFERLGLEERFIRAAVENMVGPSNESAQGDPLPSRRAKRVIDLAVGESRELHHNYVGTEHLLLALLRNDDPETVGTVAVGLLENLGAGVAEVRRAVRAVMEVLTTNPEVPQTRVFVVTGRVDGRTLGALDELVEAGVHATRSAAAAHLIAAAMRANQALLERVHADAEEIRRVRADTNALAQQWEVEAATDTPRCPSVLANPNHRADRCSGQASGSAGEPTAVKVVLTKEQANASREGAWDRDRFARA